MTTKEKIIKLIKKNGQQTVKELSDKLKVSPQMIHRHLNSLLEKNVIQKIGSAPIVFYTLFKKQIGESISISSKNKEIIEKNFLFISPQGERFDGEKGFILWCQKRNLDPIKKSEEYNKIYTTYEKLKKDNLISGKSKIVTTFEKNTCLNDVFISDFYAWEIFGKTKLGQLLLYAKQSQNKKIMQEVINNIKPDVQYLINKKKIEAIGFIPPTVKRQTQFMKILEQALKISLPKIKIVKVQTEIITPQKTLSKLQDRIENADNTIFVKKENKYKNVLLIDDALGSGATLNQVACKIKKGKIGKNVYGYALTGSVKGFDVISEI